LNSRPETLYAIGKVEKAFGIKGEVVVKPMTGSPARFRRLKRVYVGRREDDVRTLTVQHATVDGRGVRLRFVEAQDRTSAEALAGCLLFVNESQRVKPRKGTHFVHDIVGLQVLDENNEQVGVVKEVLRMPAQDVYVIAWEGREWMIPAVREFITSVDVAGGTMRVRTIEGLVNP